VVSNTKNTSLVNPEKEISKLLSAVLLKTNSEFKNKVFSVGGFVRDQILNIESNDLDLVVEISGGAEKFVSFLNSQFKNETTTAFQKGLGYPIWFLKYKTDVVYNEQIFKTSNGSIDIADSQKECFPDPTTRQRITTFGNLNEDIRRRDFTINMLAENLTTHEVLDLSGSGLNDLKSGLIKTHPQTHPDQVFSDDPLRMIRAIRFATKYNFKIESTILDSIARNKSRLQILSSERIWDEFKKMIGNGTFRQALELFKQTELDQFLFKNLAPVTYNNSDFLTADKDIILNLFVLLKNQSAEKAVQFLSALKVETSTKKAVLEILKANSELELNSRSWNLVDYRRFFRKYHDYTDAVLKIHPEISTQRNQALSVRLQKTATMNGHDVMKHFGVKGILIQTILDRALVLEDELALQYQKDPSDENVQKEILEKLKIEFKNV
jgi:tRNA nucleotidyltransferase/poly(A) polymerase